MFMHLLWLTGANWDDILPTAVTAEWKDGSEPKPNLSQFKFIVSSMHCMPVLSTVSCDLKNEVAPLKTLSLPRLELKRSGFNIQNAGKSPNSHAFFGQPKFRIDWCRTIVLAWTSFKVQNIDAIELYSLPTHVLFQFRKITYKNA